MKKKLQQAIEAHDVPTVRNILIEMVTAKGGSVSALEDMAGAIAATKDLFVKDDGKIYASSAKELTATEIEALREDVKQNFSVPKFKLLAEVQEIERTHPSYFKNRVQEVNLNVDYAEDTMIEDTMIIEEEIVADRVVVAEIADRPDKSDPADCPGSLDCSSRPDKSGRAIKICGYVIMLLGLVTSIVGLCIPVRFMIGLGIGVLMLGAGIIYVSINQKRNP